MRLRLNEEEEISFWKSIEDQINSRLNLGSSINWTRKDINIIIDDMSKVLSDLAKNDLKIQGQCNINLDKSNSQLISESTIRRIFLTKDSRITRDFMKNRFTYYIANQAADDYIEKNDFILTQKINYNKNWLDKYDQKIVEIEYRPLKLYFNITEYSDIEIAQGIAFLSDLYRSIGGDSLIIDDTSICEIEHINEPLMLV